MQLAANAGELFYASLVNGVGFVLKQEEAERLLWDNPRNADVLFPYVGGEDVNSAPTHIGSRWIINFRDWTLERAAQYPACLKIVRERVKPARDELPASKRRVRDNWWRYEHEAAELYQAIEGVNQVIAITSVSKWALPARVSARNVFAHTVYVFRYGDHERFGVLSSAFHSCWAIANASTLETRLRYTPTTVFGTFPQPSAQGSLWTTVGMIGQALNEFRADLMIRTNLGLTKTYNRVHNPDEHDADIVRLRELHVELDHAVRDAYGWNDLPLDHHHWETPQGMRFTVSPAAKNELLDRLLELNHERYAAEVAAGFHDKKGMGKASTKRAARVATRGQGSIL